MVTAWRWLLAAAVVPLVIGGCTSTPGRTAARTASAAPGDHRGLSAVRHVWVIELDNQGYAQSFGTPAADPYLAKTLPRMGALLENYYAIGHASADNYVAQVSGRAGISPSHLNVPLPGKAGPGGGRIGAVLLSPLIRPGTVSAVQYNHYSLLRTIEDIFGLPHLGDAAMPQVRSFSADIFG